MTTPTISNNKIIFLVAFVCAALMTSLFVYHTNHKQSLPVIAGGNATIFPAARDIKPFELVSHREQAFTQQDFLNHWTLVTFGFTHCNTICPASMNMLAHAYSALHEQFPTLQVVFISLDPEHDSTAALAKYVNSYQPAFIGVSGKTKNLRALQAQLGIYSQREANSNQIQHTTSILLINPQGKWAGLYNQGMNPAQFTSAVADSIHALNPG